MQKYVSLINSNNVLDIVEKKITFSELKERKLHQFYRVCRDDKEREEAFQYVENVFSLIMPFFDNITIEEYDAISKYGRKIGTNSYEINDALRNNKILSYENRISIKLIDSLMGKFQTQEEITVYRALKPIVNYRFEEMMGQTFTDPGYMSTSLNKITSYAYFEEYPIVLEIALPIGTNCLYAEWFKGANDENELLIARGTTISVGNVRKEIINGHEKTVYSCSITNQISKENYEDYQLSRMHK